MGVRGLTTYINYNQDVFLQDFLLHDSCLVIDGHSLCAQLYRLLNCFSAFGGDYDKFANYVRNFFKNLKKCNITPYVLFDGSHEGKKLKTAYSRLKSKIIGVSKLDPVTQDSMKIFPLLLRDVFKEAVADMNVPFTVCEFEADDEIAAMARHLNCPVLSYDSDFFIYNVLYIPFNTLDFKPKPVDVDGTRTMVMECKIFRMEHLVNIFGGLQEELLPLLATLLGNDYVQKRVFNKFFSQLKLPKSKKKANDQQRCVHGLFKWLQNETLDSAIAKILGRLKKRQKNYVLFVIKRSIDGYNKRHCRSLVYFDIPEDEIPESDWQPPDDIDEQINSLAEDSNDNELSSENEEEEFSEDEEDVEDEEDERFINGLPEWCANAIRLNYIPKPYINLYTHNLYFCSPQAEDYNDEDSFLCCLPILRYAFDLLTDYSNKHLLYVCREKASYKRLYVDREHATARTFSLPFSDLTVEQLHFCFYHFLREKLPKLDPTVIEVLPSNFQLFFIAVLWWVTKCEVPLRHVHSLFMTYTMLEAIDEKTGTFRGNFQFNNKYSKKVEELKANPIPTNYDADELFLNKNKVQYEDCLIAASVLLKHFELDDKIKKKPKTYDKHAMQSFAQFQHSLMQLNLLNTLCRNPYEPTKYSKSFNGTFAYNFSLKLENQMDPKNFIHQYLKGATTVLMFYDSLYSIYEKCVEKMDLTNTTWTGKKKRRRKNKVDSEIDFIVKGFESEVVI
ncbi:protein asteroid-like [Anticarsia gemmatalis]|uniref:protein asteroid-like n=1 Tax=Anticarsia gemmatalis TaxID=129554 RepID=UPI003F75BE8C